MSGPPPSPNEFEPFTGLPRWSRALVDIAQLARKQTDGRPLGIVSVFIPPTPTIYRLNPETAHQLRKAVSDRLQAVLRPQDRLFSLTHWEWLVLMPDLMSPASLTLAMLRLRGCLVDAFATLDGDALALTGYCGAALCPDDGSDPQHLVQSARIARLYGKRNDSGVEVYHADMDERDREQTQRLADLPNALAGIGDRPLCLHLQPQVALPGRRCVGAEALLRWPQSDGISMPPPHIIAALDKLGLRFRFARWLLNQAMQIITQLDEAGIGIPISINLSASDLLDFELPDLVGQALATWEIPPRRLRLEITETMMVEESQQVSEVLSGLRALGLSLSIDDFGTGYAGMSYLQRLPVDEVKIDQRFVRQAAVNPRDREIIASIAQLAHRLNLTVLAEGVEDESTAEVLHTLGCDQAQGYLFARPVPLADFIAWHRRTQTA